MGNKLIVIEDDVATVHLLRRYIQRAGWQPEFEHFEYGTDATAYLLDNLNADIVILLDLNLPDMSGIDILKVIRQQAIYATIPVIVLTTSNLEHERQACFALGVEHFLEKPFNLESVVDLIQTYDVVFA